ncbi:SusC/RagA family TonB-linked outer membrane protein [Draconibacterium mangrovi]|uniref:SusC/RagA family TonB-linked outer membrane protein n=1 Tax=Draconibacterium mangrovi TaxID=2697469 RepID=UPI0013D634BD|nr:TonB-dependent receptor [Draconibacterium mangrovi]
MKEKLTFFPSSKTGKGNKFSRKAVCIAFFLLAPLVFVNANENHEKANGKPEHIDRLNDYSEQAEKNITGVVVDAEGNAMPGVTVYVKGTTTGTVTDIDGKYSIRSKNEEDILVFTFIGMTSQEIPVTGKTVISVTMENATELLDDVVVVGYGVQKKESVVGAITQATGEELLQAGGVTNVGEALQGRLPGVTTIYSSGLPGESDPQIFIRGQSSWNGSGQPLILVDGVERSMSDIDLNEIDQISVLKDASATAVFGVKGANGVILITTKRGKTGKAQLTLSANSTIKMPSKLPNKLDSYDAIMIGNESIMRELMYAPGSWDQYTPMTIADKYRNPASIEEGYQYPNIDWADELLKDFATDYRVNLSVRGGSDFAKYFGSLSYQAINDIFNGSKYPNKKGYESGYNYNRFNYRSNLDFNITKTTTFSVNLSGFLGIQEKPQEDLRLAVSSIYELAPSIYTPLYPDGYYGSEVSFDWNLKNPIVSLTSAGYNTYNKVQINSDFLLDQKLDFITEGLSFKGKLSYDNDMTSSQQLSDPAISGYENLVFRVYNGDEELIISPPGINDFDFVVQPWTLNNMQVQNGTRMRRLNYELSLNYNRIFAKKHNLSALFLFKREEFAIGNMFPRFREDWVGRITYNYDSRYFIDVNGAYNGSEKFGTGYRFDLFPSAALGWMVSNETFMKGLTWLDKLKIRGSYGLVGDDNFSGRWKYMTQWGSGNYAFLVPSQFDGRSPYLWYKEVSVGNPDLQWETAIKSNIGLEVSLWENMVTADFDYFMEDRDNILISGNQRSVPDFYGTAPPDFNSGQVEVRGYELVLGFNYKFKNGIKTWVNYSFTDAKDKIIYKEDPALRPFYQKAEGYPIGQTRKPIAGDLMTSWDDVYMSTPLASNQGYRRIGYYDYVDFDADGAYNGAYDNAPYGYTNRPERTWNLTAGAGYKGFNIMVQLYGTQNATRQYDTRTFEKQTDLFFAHKLGYWSKDNPTGTTTLPSWSLSQGATDPYGNYYDASLVRLKTVEISYDIPKKICTKIGISGLKVFANGNNLYLWTDLPDDREFNGNNTLNSNFRGDYPTMKRFNFGLNLNF